MTNIQFIRFFAPILLLLASCQNQSGSPQPENPETANAEGARRHAHPPYRRASQ